MFLEFKEKESGVFEARQDYRGTTISYSLAQLESGKFNIEASLPDGKVLFSSASDTEELALTGAERFASDVAFGDKDVELDGYISMPKYPIDDE